MNERIKELGEQVNLLGEFTPTKIPGRYVGYITEEQIKKFAELIVRECARALDNKLSNPNFASMDWCDGSDLLEHFGIEE